MSHTYNTSSSGSSGKIQWKRDDVAYTIIDFESVKQKQSQREFAKMQGVPRTSLQHWLARKDSIEGSGVVRDFFESPDGNAFLHRLVTAAHFEFTKNGPASIHNVSNFLDLCGLSPFIAASYSTHRRVSNKMDDVMIAFGQSEQKRLSQSMPAKKISLCEDETFHPEVCLVGMEPLSRFILLEEYADNRESATWNRVVDKALGDLPVEVIQVVSDEARALINHATKGLKTHHSSDCFHVVHEIGKGTSGALAAAVKKREKEYEVAVKETETRIRLKNRYDNQPKAPRGRRPLFEKRIDTALHQQRQAEDALTQARQNQEVVRTAKAEIGNVYHPYELQTGKKQTPEKVSQHLESCFERIYDAIEGLSDRCKKRVEKAHRVVNKMVFNVVFFFNMIELCMDNMQISGRQRQLMHDYLIPGFYLKRAAGKEKDSERRAQILEKSKELLAILDDQNGPVAGYSQADIKRLEEAAKQCSNIFQRSSSCVEGRNAQLSLRHHGIHRLSDRHLKALTIVHNYHMRDGTGTTPAERFFEAKHRNLFKWILDNMDYPPRPRKRARKAA